MIIQYLGVFVYLLACFPFQFFSLCRLFFCLCLFHSVSIHMFSHASPNSFFLWFNTLLHSCTIHFFSHYFVFSSFRLQIALLWISKWIYINSPCHLSFRSVSSPSSNKLQKYLWHIGMARYYFEPDWKLKRFLWIGTWVVRNESQSTSWGQILLLIWASVFFSLQWGQ